jgi:NAD(P)-dependent dehydrogenase (short-subunit alcohol dehydrogenase family)
MDPISFAGQTVIVTGGGRGLGRSYCLELARRGASIVVNDIGREFADETVRDAVAAGGKAVASYDNITTQDGAAEIVRLAVDSFGTVSAVINNAGTMRNGYFDDQTPEMLDAMLDVHVRGAWFVTQAAWPIMREAKYGRVIMTTSTAGLFAMQGQANYAAAKGAVYGLCKALAYEGKEHGICTNAVLPAAATTLSAGDPVPDMAKHAPPGVKDAMAPRRRADLVAPFVAFLASPACELNGEAFAAGFGRFAQVFIAEAPGWIAPDVSDGVSIEDVISHLDEIREREGYFVPLHLHDETASVARIVLAAAND